MNSDTHYLGTVGFRSPLAHEDRDPEITIIDSWIGPNSTRIPLATPCMRTNNATYSHSAQMSWQRECSGVCNNSVSEFPLQLSSRICIIMAPIIEFDFAIYTPARKGTKNKKPTKYVRIHSNRVRFASGSEQEMKDRVAAETKPIHLPLFDATSMEHDEAYDSINWDAKAFAINRDELACHLAAVLAGKVRSLLPSLHSAIASAIGPHHRRTPNILLQYAYSELRRNRHAASRGHRLSCLGAGRQDCCSAPSVVMLTASCTSTGLI